MSFTKEQITALMSFMSEEDKQLAILAAQVRLIVLEKSDESLKDFHVTLGPDALNKTAEELAEEALSWDQYPHTIVTDIDSHLDQTRFDEPFDSLPPESSEARSIDDFLKDI